MPCSRPGRLDEGKRNTSTRPFTPLHYVLLQTFPTSYILHALPRMLCNMPSLAVKMPPSAATSSGLIPRRNLATSPIPAAAASVHIPRSVSASDSRRDQMLFPWYAYQLKITESNDTLTKITVGCIRTNHGLRALLLGRAAAVRAERDAQMTRQQRSRPDSEAGRRLHGADALHGRVHPQLG